MTDPQPSAPLTDPRPAWARLGLPGPVEAPPTRPRRRWPRRLFGGAALVSVCLCLGALVCVKTGFGTGLDPLEEAPRITRLIDSFMTAMVERDPAAAYALFSTRAAQQMTIADIEARLTDANYRMFVNYREAKLGSVNIGPSFNTNPAVPQGTLADVTGTLIYSDGYTGDFQAKLELEDGHWRLVYFHLNVPPEKLLAEPEPQGLAMPKFSGHREAHP